MRVAVVTGATGGLGRALAQRLEQADYFQILCGRTRNDRLPRLKAGAHATCWTDLSTPEGAHDLLKAFEDTHADRLDLVVNCAGVAHAPKPAEGLTPDEVYETFETNVFPLFHIASWAVPLMRKQGFGLIMNISSYCGRRAIRNLAAYCSSKFAVRGFTEALAQELEGSGVRCVSLSPGGMNTQMRASLFGHADAARQMEPAVIAEVIRDIADGNPTVNNGDDVVIRRGRVTVIPPEQGVVEE